MPINVISETEFRKKIAVTLEKVEKEDQTLFVTKSGHAVATLMSLDKYNRILSELEDRLDEKDEQLLQGISEARKDYRAGKVKKLEDIAKFKK